jgi:hypothetical protein
MTDPHTYLLTNARVVLANRVLPQAWVAVADGRSRTSARAARPRRASTWAATS